MDPKVGRLFKIEKVFLGNTCALVNINNGLRIAFINGKNLKHYKPTMYEVKF